MWKFSEEDLAQERAEGKAEFIEMLVRNGKSLKEIADFCSMSEDEINNILQTRI